MRMAMALLLFCCNFILGCESVAGRPLSRSEASMDYNPGWEHSDDDKITSFEQLPRHKNMLSGGHYDG